MKTKMPKDTIKGLTLLVEHTRRDIHYGEGGTYTKDDGTVAKTEIKLAQKAMDWIETYVNEYIAEAQK